MATVDVAARGELLALPGPVADACERLRYYAGHFADGDTASDAADNLAAFHRAQCARIRTALAALDEPCIFCDKRLGWQEEDGLGYDSPSTSSSSGSPSPPSGSGRDSAST